MRELGRRLGFSLEDVERGLADWQRRKRANPDTDPYELGLVAVTRKEFDQAQRLFRQSRLRHEAALLEAERNLARVQEQVAEQRRLVIRDLRAEGNAAYLAYDFAAALKRFQQALERTDPASDPEGWADSLMAVAKAHYQIGIRTHGTAVYEHLAEAREAFQGALPIYQAAGAGHYVGIVERNLARTEVLLSGEDDH